MSALKKGETVTLLNLGRKSPQVFPIGQALRLLQMQKSQKVKTFELKDENFEFVNDELVRRAKEGNSKKSPTKTDD